MGGAITVYANCVSAQIIPDRTLPNNSIVPLNCTNCEITGGTKVGENLFHSFQEFSVPTGGTAYFNNALDIQNIISRVTGGSASNIDGLIRANGANLFLINPNGIIFGPNASLNIGGSFVGTTANALQFGNIGFFSATEKNAPSPLLTINPSALLFNQINQNAAIQNKSVASAGIDPARFYASGLRVPDGKSLMLVGGNVSMDGGELNAYSGRVELGGLAEAGTVALGVDGDNLSLTFPDNVARSSVSLTNEAAIYVEGAGGGNIAVNASNLEILEGSILSGGIGKGLGTPETIGGDITLNATGSIKVAGGSIVRNLVRLGSQGNGGNITIDSGSFSLRNHAELQTSTSGRGNGGNVTVTARDAVDLADNAAIFSIVRAGGVGNGGSITIDSGSFSLQNGAQLVSSTFGQGNAGNVTVSAKNAADLADNAGILSRVEAGGVGKGGNININAATLSLIDGAQLAIGTRGASNTKPAGRGDAGNVNINVTGAVDIAGEKNGFRSGIGSFVETGTVGSGGNITIDSGSFSLQNGAQLESSTFGHGNGGNITIDSGSFSLQNGTQLVSSTFGQGNAGNVTVSAKNAVSLADNAAILSTVEAGGVGKGGNININAATLSLIDGAQLDTSTRDASDTQPAGRGDAGNVNVNVTGSVNIAGEKNGFVSAIISRVETGTVGNGGNITIDSGSFSLRDHAQLQALTSGQGNAGNVTVSAKNAVDLADNAYIFSTVESGGVGKGGNININAATLSLIDGAQLQASTRGQGNAGNVTVSAKNAVDLADNAYIFSTVESGGVGKGGNININAATLSLIDGGSLQTLTRGASDTQPAGRGDAGNVNVNVTGSVNIAGEKNGFVSGIGSFVETGTVGNGGNITIDSGSFSLQNGAQLTALTSGFGNAGNVNVNVTGSVNIAGEKNGVVSAIISRVETGTVGNGGNITIDSGSFSLQNGAQLESSTFGQGNAGNVTVRALDAVDLADNAAIFSRVSAGGVGKGGNININAATLSLIDGAQLQTLTRGASDTQPAGRGDAGNVNVNVTGIVDITGEKNDFESGIFSSVETGTVGNGGNITIDSGSFSLQNGAQLSAEIAGQGNAGTIKVNADDFFTISSSSPDVNSGLFVNSQSPTGTAGNIIVNSPRVTLDNGGTLNAQSASGNGGNINLQTDLLLLRRGASISTTAGTAEAGGDGGNINIDARPGFIVAVPSENSDITANAYTGKGGNVHINTTGIFGIQRRKFNTPQSDITASSQFGLNGTVQINTPGVDPSRGLVQLPTNLVDATQQIDTGCNVGGKQRKSSFIVTGRGLPPQPSEPLRTEAVIVNGVEAPEENRSASVNFTPSSTNRIIEATGWVVNNLGEITLTAYPTSVTPSQNLRSTPATCHAS